MIIIFQSQRMIHSFDIQHVPAEFTKELLQTLIKKIYVEYLFEPIGYVDAQETEQEGVYIITLYPTVVDLEDVRTQLQQVNRKGERKS